MTRRFAGSDLVRSARAIAESVLAAWPELIPARDGPTRDAGRLAGRDPDEAGSRASGRR